jgi:heme-degrading monooxygenase HmoA
MHARVSTYQGGDAAGIVEGFKSVTGELEQMDGFSHALFLVDPATGDAMSITVWESEDALEASSAQADELRQKGTAPSGSTITSVKHFKVGHTAGTPARA